MVKTISMFVGDHFAGFIDSQVRSGRYGLASDVVQAGLRLLEEQDAKIRALQDALADGENSGKPVALDFDTFLAGKRKSFEQDG